jgi:hypothetical protein
VTFSYFRKKKRDKERRKLEQRLEVPQARPEEDPEGQEREPEAERTPGEVQQAGRRYTKAELAYKKQQEKMVSQVPFRKPALFFLKLHNAEKNNGVFIIISAKRAHQTEGNDDPQTTRRGI